VINYAFEKLGAAALFASHNPNNDASRPLLEKLGFQYTHKQLYPQTGLEHPSYIVRRMRRVGRMSEWERQEL
jgi:ribosomal-protein-alanine N-acetyltransferase